MQDKSAICKSFFCHAVGVNTIFNLSIHHPKDLPTVFNHLQFGMIRTIEIEGEAWFVGKDVAEALGYERGTKAVQDHVDEEDRDAVPIQDSIGHMQNTPIINESGLYTLILSSKLESAKRFKCWVTSEVLPSIRKTGDYVNPSQSDLFLDTLRGEKFLNRVDVKIS